MDTAKLQRYQRGEMDLAEALKFQDELLQDQNRTFATTVRACRGVLNTICELIEDGEPGEARILAENTVSEIDAANAKAQAFTATVQAGWDPANHE